MRFRIRDVGFGDLKIGLGLGLGLGLGVGLGLGMHIMCDHEK